MIVIAIVDEDEIGKVYQSLPVMVAALDDFLSKLLKQCLQGINRGRSRRGKNSLFTFDNDGNPFIPNHR